MALRPHSALPFPDFFLMTNVGDELEGSSVRCAAPVPAVPVPVIFVTSKAIVPPTGLSANHFKVRKL